MNKEAWRTLAFVSVGLVASLISVAIDLALRPESGDPPSTLALLGLILICVAAVGYLGTYVAELVGTNIESEGGRPKVYLKSLWIYLL